MAMGTIAKIAVGVVAAASIGALGWWGVEVIGEAEGNRATQGSDLMPTVAEGLARAQPVLDDSSSREEIPAPVEALAQDPLRESDASLRLFGIILPAEGRTALSEEPFVSLTDHLGEQLRGNGGLDGAYSFPDLSAGRYWITASSLEDGTASAVVDLDASTLEKRFDIQLALPAEILVKVVDGNGLPLCPIPSIETVESYRCPAPLLAVATSEPPSEWFDDLVGNMNEDYSVGNFRENGFAGKKLPDAYLGTLVLHVEPPVHVSLVHYQHLVQTKHVEKGQTEVEFVLDPDAPEVQPGGFRFRLVDATTQVLLEKASVELVAGAFLDGMRSQQGVFRSRPLAPGWYELRVRMDGYEALHYRSRVEPGIESDLSDIALSRELWVAGKVTDDSGQGVRIKWQIMASDRAGNTATPTRVVELHSSNDAGEFRIGGLSRGIYLLSLWARDTSWARTTKLIDTTAGPIDDLQIELERGVPLVLSSSDEGWTAVRYKILDASGLVVIASRLWSPEPRKILLAPGHYELETQMVEAPDSVRRIPITIGSEPVELVLP